MKKFFKFFFFSLLVSNLSILNLSSAATAADPSETQRATVVHGRQELYSLEYAEGLGEELTDFQHRKRSGLLGLSSSEDYRTNFEEIERTLGRQKATKVLSTRIFAYQLMLQEKLFQILKIIIPTYEKIEKTLEKQNELYQNISGQQLTVSSSDGMLTLYTIREFDQLYQLAKTPKEICDCMALNPDEISEIKQLLIEREFSPSAAKLIELYDSTNSFKSKVATALATEIYLKKLERDKVHNDSISILCTYKKNHPFKKEYLQCNWPENINLRRAQISLVGLLSSYFLQTDSEKSLSELVQERKQKVHVNIEELKQICTQYDHDREHLNKLYIQAIKKINQPRPYFLPKIPFTDETCEYETPLDLANYHLLKEQVYEAGKPFPSSLDDINVYNYKSASFVQQEPSIEQATDSAEATTTKSPRHKRRRGKKRRSPRHSPSHATAVDSAPQGAAAAACSPESFEAIAEIQPSVPTEPETQAPQASISHDAVAEVVGDVEDGNIIDLPYCTIIKDETNNAQITLYKVAHKDIELFVYNQHKRVSRWFEDPNRIFEEDVEYIDSKERIRPWIKTSHAFTRLVDVHLFLLGIQTPWVSRSRVDQVDTCINIPGEITTSDQKRHIGIFSYAFFTTHTGENVCYHRHFSTWPKNRLLKEKLEQGYWNVEFPCLPDSSRAAEAAAMS